jgi:hypothetical protein
VDARTDPVVLWARAALLAFLACFLGVAGHVTADGLLPGPFWLVVLFLLAVAVCGPLLARPASALRLVVLLVAGQTAVHLVLTVAAGHRGDQRPPVSVPAPAALPVVDGRRVGSLQDQYDAAVGTTHVQPAIPVGHLVQDLSAHAPMMAVHLLAAVLLGLWLAVGERSLWTLLALASAAVLRPLLLAWALVHGRPVAPTAGLGTVPAEPPGIRRLLRLARCVVRRGPPALLAAA